MLRPWGASHLTITAEIEPSKGWLVATATGAITYDDVIAHLVDERAKHHLAHRELIDASCATLEFSPSEVRGIVALLGKLGEGEELGPTAVVVGSDYAFGMMRMLEIILDDAPCVRPFRSRQDAEVWLTRAPSYRPRDGS